MGKNGSQGIQETLNFAEFLQTLDDKVAESLLWEKIAELQGTSLKTSGRNGFGGVEFTYSVKKDKTGS